MTIDKYLMNAPAPVIFGWVMAIAGITVALVLVAASAGLLIVLAMGGKL